MIDASAINASAINAYAINASAINASAINAAFVRDPEPSGNLANRNLANRNLGGIARFTCAPARPKHLGLAEDVTGDRIEIVFAQVPHFRENIRTLRGGVQLRNVRKTIIGRGILHIVYQTINVVTGGRCPRQGFRG